LSADEAATFTLFDDESFERLAGSDILAFQRIERCHIIFRVACSSWPAFADVLPELLSPLSSLSIRFLRAASSDCFFRHYFSSVRLSADIGFSPDYGRRQLIFSVSR
jgi:hypothetical protein